MSSDPIHFVFESLEIFEKKEVCYGNGKPQRCIQNPAKYLR